jgi:uncharacterized protein (DUF2147 family)
MRNIRLIRFAAALITFTGLSCANVLASDGEPLGIWLTADGESHIRIAHCGQALCGDVVWLREPADRYGNPYVDTNNPNPSLRDRQLLGMTIFFDLLPTSPGDEWRGRVYNPKDGDTYLAFISIQSEQRLKVRGCVLGGAICSSQTWRRVEQTSQGSGSASNTAGGVEDSVR